MGGDHREHTQTVKGLRPPSRPRSSFNDVALRDCQNCRISRPYRDAQDRLFWRDLSCTYLAHHELESVLIIIIIIIIIIIVVVVVAAKAADALYDKALTTATA